VYQWTVSGSCLFFFFQAEDGIRDWSVTGVQTCALPIYAADTSLKRSSACLLFVNPNNKQAEERFKEVSAAFEILGDEKRRKLFRSEERRVGKECRCRGEPDH